MIKSNPNYLFNNFSHIYVEKQAISYSITKNILSKFKNSQLIIIEDYKNIFCKPKQDVASQKQSKKLILALKKESFYYNNPDVCQDFGYKNPYYSSCALNCLYNCQYCFLQGMYSTANILIFVNLEDYFAQIDKLAKNMSIHLSISYDTDLLAMENFLGYINQWITFVKTNKNITLEIRTKSANFHLIKKIMPSDNIVLAWSLSPEAVIKKYENLTPNLDMRLKALNMAITNKWMVRLCLDPIIKLDNWQTIYKEFIIKIFATVDSQKINSISIGSFRIPKDYLKSMKKSALQSDLIFYPYKLNNNIYAYKDETLILEFIYNILSLYFNQDKIFR